LSTESLDSKNDTVKLYNYICLAMLDYFWRLKADTTSIKQWINYLNKNWIKFT